MKLLYIILAHDRPEQAAELARVMTHNAADAHAYVHFDARAPAEWFARLQAAVAAEPRTHLVMPRVPTGWGMFGLVSAVVNAVQQIRDAGIEPDYVLLLSGADVPVRPAAQLERFLREHKGREFIESYDESWIVDGLRSARYRLFFPFNARAQPRLHRGFERLQKQLGVRRRFPKGLRPRFGSQWWALSWPTCAAILDYVTRNRRHYRFFRSVWIPDEMFFQTMVDALVDRARIAGHGLTHYQFTDKGKPVVFHDDHADYVRGLDKFFVRKCSPRAERLRAACLAVAAGADDGRPVDPGQGHAADYRDKIAAQTAYPPPGSLYYRDQYADHTLEMMQRPERPFVLLVGVPGIVRAAMAELDGGPFQALGEPFAATSVDFQDQASALRGLRRDDAAIRDMHPGLYFHRLLSRCDGVPVLSCCEATYPQLLHWLTANPAATVVACLPVTAHCELDEAVTYASALSERELRAFERDLPIAEAADALARARRDRLRDSSALAAALSDLLAARQRLPRVADDCMPAVHLPCAYGDDAPPGCAPATLFERSLQCANGNTRPWFGELTARLRGFAERELWGAARRTPLGPACHQRIVRYAPALDSRANAILRDGAVEQQWIA